MSIFQNKSNDYYSKRHELVVVVLKAYLQPSSSRLYKVRCIYTQWTKNRKIVQWEMCCMIILKAKINNKSFRISHFEKKIVHFFSDFSLLCPR